MDTFQVTVDPVAAEGLTAAVNAALAQAGVSDRIRAELIETPDLQSLLDAISGMDDHASVRIKTITWNGAVQVITLKLDNQYWPAYEIRRTDDGWVRESIG